MQYRVHEVISTESIQLTREFQKRLKKSARGTINSCCDVWNGMHTCYLRNAYLKRDAPTMTGWLSVQSIPQRSGLLSLHY